MNTSDASQQTGVPPIPRLEHSENTYRLLVDGRPFLILGGQSNNSSASHPADLEPVWRVLHNLHANTAEIPLYWEAIEPERGVYDFQSVDAVIAGARRHGLRLVLLWFATWKNGEMHYTPEWVKRDRSQYPRVRGAWGEELDILSPLSEDSCAADARAFAALMQHIREIDETTRTVIMIQVENETGLLGTDRDYGEAATRLFRSAVPTDLMDYLHTHKDQLSAGLQAGWAETGCSSTGTWSDVFGDLAAELFSAWHIARYVDRVAAAGKQAYPLPMYTNAWLIEPGAERAGRWPSGGPTEHALDIWKAAAPHIDLLAPDIYYPKYAEVCAEYTRPDNPLFVPEVNPLGYFAPNAFLTFARFNGLGFCPFAVDQFDDGEKLTAAASDYEDTYRVLRPLLPMIARYQYTNRLHAIIQGVAQGEDWGCAIRIGGRRVARIEFTSVFQLEQGRGRGMLIVLASDDIVVVGAGFKVIFRELDGPPRDADILSIEEGSFDDERWVRTRRLNGDERHVTLPAKARVLRVRLLPRSEER